MPDKDEQEQETVPVMESESLEARVATLEAQVKALTEAHNKAHNCYNQV